MKSRRKYLQAKARKQGEGLLWLGVMRNWLAALVVLAQAYEAAKVAASCSLYCYLWSSVRYLPLWLSTAACAR